MGYPIQLSSTGQNLLFMMVSASDHITGATGKSPTVLLSKNGATFASPAGAVTEVANGWYQVAGNATDSGTLGPLALHATASGCDPSDDVFMVVAYNPLDAVHLGLTALPNAAAAASGGLPTVGTSSGQISLSSGNVSLAATPPTSAAIATAVWQDATAGDFTTSGSVGKLLFTDGVKVSAGTGAGQISLSSGTVTVGTNSDKTGYKLATDGIDTISIDSINARQALAMCSAVLVGVTSGAPTGPIVIKGVGVATTRVSATVDSSGNRSALTLTPP